MQKAFSIAQQLRMDPFANKRNLVATPEIQTPLFLKHEIRRDKLAAKVIIGYGQVWHLPRARQTGMTAAVRQSVRRRVRG